MPSPFPGMDPYLESYLWPDVHNALASKMRQMLTPKLRPRYTARLEIYLVEDPTPDGEIGILYPDVEVIQVKQTNKTLSTSSIVHLIEIDLLRRGTRPFNHPRLPDVPYFVTLTRAQSGVVEVWPIHLQDRLPTIPIPLRQPDPDIALQLSEALNAIYDEAAYDLSIDYTQPPPPPSFSNGDIQWMQAIVSNC